MTVELSGHPESEHDVGALLATDPPEVLDRSAVWWWLDATVAEPTGPALLSADGRVLSRSQLASRIGSVRNHLLDQGINRDDRLGLVMSSRSATAISLLGGMAAAAVAPLVPTSPIESFVDDLERLRVSRVLVDDQPPPALVDAAARVGVPLLGLDPSALPARVPSLAARRHPEPSDLALLLQTSGTTSRPKVVPLSHANLFASARNIARTLRLCPKDRGLSAMPLFHIHGVVGSLLTPLVAGGSVIVSDGMDADLLVDLLEDSEPTWLTAVPTLLQAVLAASERRGGARHRLRLLRSSSSSMPSALLQRLEAHFRVPVIEAYGMTEAASQVCSNSLPGLGPDRQPGSVGPPAGPEVAVLNADLEPVPAGQTGEVAIRGANVTVGYEAADHDGWSADGCGKRWFRTGDEGYFDTEGRLVLAGRLREMISRGGERVVPRRVDEVLIDHPAVEQAVAFAVPHPTLGADLAAAVTLRPGCSVGESELRHHAFARLAAHEVPSRVVVVAELPCDASGKPKRAGLAERLAGVLVSAGEPAVGRLEELVSATFSDLLEQAVPGRDANFFLLGGDSLSGTRVISRLAQALSLDLNPSILFDCPTVRGLAERLQEWGDQSPLQGKRPHTAIELELAEPLQGSWPDGCQLYPASYAQERLWFLHQLNPALTAYHLPAVWRLRGPLDLAALDRALTALVERHSTMRSSFQLRGDELLQVVHPCAPVTAVVETLNDRDPQAVVDKWMQHENDTPFDLRSGMLLRARLLELSPDENLLLLNHHHIASDGWSRSVLSRDLVELYNAVRHDRDSRLPPLPVGYQDYTRWQRRRLTGQYRDTLRDYWSANLQGIEPLQLPTDHPRPAEPSHRGATVDLDVEPALAMAFEDICRQQGATLQMGLLAVVSLLIHRYSRQDDFAVGVPIWGRNHPDLEPMMGLFVNTLPIRMLIDDRESFRQLLNQVRDTSIAAYRHQDFPFEEMVELSHLERDTSRNPLVQCMFQLIEWPNPSLKGLAGLQSESIVDRAASARFDLEFFLRRSDRGSLTGELLYATDLFHPGRMDRMAVHLRTLLASVVAAPESTVGTYDLLTESERDTIGSWESGPDMAIPEPGVHQLVEHQAERTPDAPAVVFGGATLTYSELNRRANQLAHHLIGIGVGPRATVAVCLERSTELVVAVLAVLKVGGVYLPLDPCWPEARRESIRRDAKAAVQVDRELCLRASGEPRATIPASHYSANPDPNSLAYVLYTSGSTGSPKAVAVPHGALSNLIDWHRSDARLGQPAMTVQFAAAVFDVSLQEIFTTLTVGGCLVLLDEETRGDPRLLWKLIVEQKVERVFLPYVALEQLALSGIAPGIKAGAYLLDIVSAGEKLALTEPIRELLRALPNCRLHNHYGPTESHVVSAHVVGDSPMLQPEGVSIGKPIGNAVIRILDPAGLRCPVGVPGELHIGGRSLARGYLNSPELTTEKFIVDPFCPSANRRLYRSGDLASWNADGTLRFYGRLDQQVKLRGYRIEPGEIESAMLAHASVAQAAVVLLGETPSDSRLVAYWVPQSTGVGAADGELREFLAEQLPDYMVPSTFIKLAGLPLTRNGKLDRRALPAAIASGDCHERSKACSLVEKQIHVIWAEILEHNSFGITDNFFLVGGNSLSVVRLATAIEKYCGKAISVRGIFARPTIVEQASWMIGLDDNLRGDAIGNLVVLQPEGDLPPLYAIHGIGGGIANFIGIARALAPHRPVFGLQGLDSDKTDPSATVSAIAARYADQILTQHPRSTPIHLVGYSAGGWYAHAVAAALIDRGAAIGVLALLDTGPGAKIRRRFRVAIHLKSRWQHYVARAGRVIHPPGGQSRRSYLAERLGARMGGLHAKVPEQGATSQAVSFATLLGGYQPPRLPLKVQLFARPARQVLLERIWRFHARGGVSVTVHPLFNEHSDFRHPEFMSALADELERVLAREECG